MATKSSWAVRLSEKKAIEHKVSSTFVNYWKGEVDRLLAEFGSISEDQRMVLSLIFDYMPYEACNPNIDVHESISFGQTYKLEISKTIWSKKFPTNLCRAFPGKYVFVEGAMKITKDHYGKIFNEASKKRLEALLYEACRAPVDDAQKSFFSFFKGENGSITSKEKQEVVNKLKREVKEQEVMIKFMGENDLHEFRIWYQKLLYSYDMAARKLSDCRARMAAEKNARRLLSGKGT